MYGSFASCAPYLAIEKPQRCTLSFGSNPMIGTVMMGWAPAARVGTMKSSADLPFEPSPDETVSGMFSKNQSAARFDVLFAQL
jgi:hypothetical protein